MNACAQPRVGVVPIVLIFAFAGIRAVAAPLLEPPMLETATRPEIDKARKSVQEELTTLKAKSGKIEHRGAAPLGEVFPKHLFFSVHFPQYPVARIPPPPLKAANLFAVNRADGKVQRLADANELATFFREQLAPAGDADMAKADVRAWLELASVYLQDGFYKFSLLEEATKVENTDSGLRASGKMIVKSGGNGEITVTLKFDKNGKLTQVDYNSKLKPGPRPICQATKLLDKDPVVRAMAEQDLLIMGREAKPYLDEQRARASPELKKAMDRIWQRIVAEE
jgi:hypothetical protein